MCGQEVTWANIEIQKIPEFDHFEIGTRQGNDGGNGAMCAFLEGEEDIFVGIRDFLGSVPGLHGLNVVDFFLESHEFVVMGGFVDGTVIIVCVSDSIRVGCVTVLNWL
jgi:hypothetical protein